MVGEGNFAKVYRYESATGGDVAVKVQKESEPWEYAILAEVQELLKGTPAEESILKLIHFTKVCSFLRFLKRKLKLSVS